MNTGSEPLVNDMDADDAMALLASCTEHEGCIVMDGRLVKLPNAVIGSMHMQASRKATDAALRSLGADFKITHDPASLGESYRVGLAPGNSMRDLQTDFDPVTSSVTVTVTLSDGRVASATEKLVLQMVQ